MGVPACENVRGMVAEIKPTWMYVRRFSQTVAPTVRVRRRGLAGRPVLFPAEQFPKIALHAVNAMTVRTHSYCKLAHVAPDLFAVAGAQAFPHLAQGSL